MALVLCVASHPIDLDDGHQLLPGETADDVDTNLEYVRGLVVDGSLQVLEGMNPRVRRLSEA